MNAMMFLQAVCLSEIFVTYVTFIRLLPSVNSFMWDEMCMTYENNVAHFTLVCVLPCMKAHVGHKVPISRKHFLAYFTLFNAGMCAFVLVKVLAHCKPSSTLITFIKFHCFDLSSIPFIRLCWRAANINKRVLSFFSQFLNTAETYKPNTRSKQYCRTIFRENEVQMHLSCLVQCEKKFFLTDI